MSPTTRRPSDPVRRRALSRELVRAMALGVKAEDIAHVVAIMSAEGRVDLDELRVALGQYVPARAFTRDAPPLLDDFDALLAA